MTNKEQSTQRERELKIAGLENYLERARQAFIVHIQKEHPGTMPTSCHSCPSYMSLIRSTEVELGELQ